MTLWPLDSVYLGAFVISSRLLLSRNSLSIPHFEQRSDTWISLSIQKQLNWIKYYFLKKNF